MEHNKLRSSFETEEVENNWAISYGDMITLLLGFFVIFFNIKTDVVNIRLLKRDLDKYFKTNSSEKAGSRSAASSEKGQETVPIITSNIANRLQIKSNIEGERILVEFPGVSFFDSASTELTQSGRQALEQFSQALSGHLGMYRLIVRGYTDSKAIRSKARYQDNLELSAFRSISAIRYLNEKGVNLDKMRIAGYGEASLSREDLQSGEDSQRKVVIVIEPLDHTERIPASVPERFSRGSQSIENTSVVVSGLNGDEGPELPGIPETLKMKIYGINDWIENQGWYQKFVEFLVVEDLKIKGFSDRQIQSIIENEEKEPK